jgi:hypothetical protein
VPYRGYDDICLILGKHCVPVGQRSTLIEVIRIQDANIAGIRQSQTGIFWSGRRVESILQLDKANLLVTSGFNGGANLGAPHVVKYDRHSKRLIFKAIETRGHSPDNRPLVGVDGYDDVDVEPRRFRFLRRAPNEFWRDGRVRIHTSDHTLPDRALAADPRLPVPPVELFLVPLAGPGPRSPVGSII